MHHSVGSGATWHSVAASLVGIDVQLSGWFVGCWLACMSAHVQYVQVCAQQFLVHHATYAVGCASWIAIESATGCINHLLAGFLQYLLYEFSQGLLGLGIGRECLF
jgi:hypothetical protein